FFAMRVGTGGPTGFFFGRLVGVPSGIFAESITLVFVAKAQDLQMQKYQLAFSTLMVLPRYDPVWVDPEKRPAQATSGELVGDIDVVLEGWAAQWYIDPVTLSVSISDLIEPEDGTLVFLENEVPRDSVDPSYNQ